MPTWDPTAEGVVRLPSGRLVRGRGLRRGQPNGPGPDFGVYLLGRRPGNVDWPHEWIRWPDFWLPTDRTHAARVLTAAWQRAATQRVEVACGGGRGRTGTGLACLAVLDGLSAGDAVAFVRTHYDRRAIETPWQKRYVSTFRGSATIDDMPHR
jgi:protein-tyrosine phosphatase